MKKAIVRTTDQVQNLTDDWQVTPSEYASDKLQYGMEDIRTEARHVVVDMGKGAYHTGKSAVQRFREKRKAAPESPLEKGREPTSTGEPGRSWAQQRSKSPSGRKNPSIKAVQKTERTIKQTQRTAERSAKKMERSVKGT